MTNARCTSSSQRNTCMNNSSSGTTDDGFQTALRVVLETTIEEEAEQFDAAAEFIRVTDEH